MVIVSHKWQPPPSHMGPSWQARGGVAERWPHRATRRAVEQVFEGAGVRCNGSRLFDPQILDDRFYTACATRGTLGFGESYVANWWACDDLEELAYRLTVSRINQVGRFAPLLAMSYLVSLLRNNQTLERSRRVADRHYNIGNDLFFSFLGRYRNYSCALFEGTESLDAAQKAKMERICELLELSERDHLLDVGGGWGHLARHAALQHGCTVTSINIADEQITYAREMCAGLPVDVRKCDYRQLTGRYTKAAVVAMFTHVGSKNHRTFFECIHRCLPEGSRLVMETVGSSHSNVTLEPWTERHIFPGGVVPSLRQIDHAASGLFVRGYTREFGSHYVLTLRAWYDNLMAAWPELSTRYSESTLRTFEYFFLTVAGTFRAGRLKHWHLVMSKV